MAAYLLRSSGHTVCKQVELQEQSCAHVELKLTSNEGFSK